MVVVTFNHLGKTWFLRNTTVTDQRERATAFATKNLARAAIERARKFHKPSFFKTANIEEK